MAKKAQEAQNPLILRSTRLMEAFAKSNDERDFYLDRIEGFIIYCDLDKSEEELDALNLEIEKHADRYAIIPKLTFYETKKIMEGFVNEKVYDIDTKEKLLDIIQSKEARDHFLEFIYDQHTELEKWQQFYQERSRVRIIEWLRANHYHFVFEEDLDIPPSTIEKVKHKLFEKSVPKEIELARKTLNSKAKSYYSNEALNPRPKRGRPPKQAQKQELEPQVSNDIYTKVPSTVRPFLFTPEIGSGLDVTFSSRFETGKELLAHRKQALEDTKHDTDMESINEKLTALRKLSSKWVEPEVVEAIPEVKEPVKEKATPKKKAAPKKAIKAKEPAKKPAKKTSTSAAKPKKAAVKRIMPDAKAKQKAKKEKATKKPAIRKIMPSQTAKKGKK